MRKSDRLVEAVMLERYELECSVSSRNGNASVTVYPLPGQEGLAGRKFLGRLSRTLCEIGGFVYGIDAKK